jgi:hypothetical protein
MKIKVGDMIVIPQKNRKDKLAIVIEKIRNDFKQSILGVYCEKKRYFIREVYVQKLEQ